MPMGENITLIKKTPVLSTTEMKTQNDSTLKKESAEFLKQFARAINYEPALDSRLGLFIANWLTIKNVIREPHPGVGSLFYAVERHQPQKRALNSG